MEYLVTLHLKSGLEIEYLMVFKKDVTIGDVREQVRKDLNGQEKWMVLADDVEVKRGEVDYFKVAELKDEEESPSESFDDMEIKTLQFKASSHKEFSERLKKLADEGSELVSARMKRFGGKKAPFDITIAYTEK